MKAKFFLALLSLVLIGERVVAANRPFLTFAHGDERLDVPREGVRLIEAVVSMHVADPVTGERREFKSLPRIEICLKGEYRRKLCDLTKRIVKKTIKVSGSCGVALDIVLREPLCLRACHTLGPYDSADEVVDLVLNLRNESERNCIAMPSRSPR